MDDVADLEFDSLCEDVTAQMQGEGLDNLEKLRELGQQASGHLMGLVGAVARTEGLLRLVDRTLRVSQPPVPGKIGVRWWKVQTWDTMRMPVLVTWHPVRGGRRWRAKVLKRVRRDRINRGGTAAVCADETYELARLAAALIRQYGVLRRALSTEQRRLKACRHAADAELSRVLASTLYQHGTVVKKLLKAGYSIGVDVGDLPSRYLVE